MNLKTCLLIPFLIMMSSSIYAQDAIINIWDQAIPNEIQSETYSEEQEVKDGKVLRISKVTVPSLALFKPIKPNGTAILVCPGGGYQYVTMEKEGVQVAKWLNSLGITVFVLKYRLPNEAIMTTKSVGPLQDAQAALRYIRQQASLYNLDDQKIGVLGFSAGGHLAASLSTQYNRDTYKTKTKLSAKPDFSILVYPVISMDDAIAHQGSKQNLLGQNPSETLVKEFSLETQVDSLTPRAFLVHATDDKSVPVEHSLRYYTALKAHQVPVEMHIYEQGGHGFGLGVSGTNHNWTAHCEAWLRANHCCD